MFALTMVTLGLSMIWLSQMRKVINKLYSDTGCLIIGPCLYSHQYFVVRASSIGPGKTEQIHTYSYNPEKSEPSCMSKFFLINIQNKAYEQPLTFCILETLKWVL